MRCPMLRLSIILAAATALAPPQGLLLGVGRVAEAHPLVFGSGLTCLKTVCSDVLVQKRVQKRKALNYRRCGVFAVYGFFYLGAVQYLLFSRVYPTIFPRCAAFAAAPAAAKLGDPMGAASVAGQILLDLGVHWPLSAIPAFYFCKAVGETGRPRGFLRAYGANWRADLAACWAIWCPAELVSFGALPIRWQVPFAALVYFGYTALVSFRRGGAAPAATAAS